MLDTETSDELHVIRCSPYITDDLLLQSMENRKYGLNILSLNCQSLHVKFDYFRLLIDKFMQKVLSKPNVCKKLDFLRKPIYPFIESQGII